MRTRALVLLFAATAIAAQTWQTALPGYRYEFPRDHFSHPDYQTEWWYYTGNLRAPDGHRYGFELTFFRQGVHLPASALKAEDETWRPDQLYLAHLALSDIDGHSFYHAERLNRAGPGLAGAGLSDARYWNANWHVRWTSLPESAQEIEATCDRFTLHLKLQPRKGPVIQGQGGVSQKGPAPGQASHYISFTRIAASGRLEIKNSAVDVSGTAWMDHEFFTEPDASDLEGWDWFAIQLENNEELMLYRLRNKSGQPNRYSSGCYVDAQGKTRFFAAADFSLTPGDVWQSPHSGARYPMVWQISVPSLDLDLKQHTDLADQELWSAGSLTPSYWEGAVSYDGTIHRQPVKGVGYTEMTGYARAIRLSGMTTQRP